MPKGPRGEKSPADVVARAVKVTRIAADETHALDGFCASSSITRCAVYSISM
jgi:hypothetical protein